MVLAHLRMGETYCDLAVGFGVGVTTAYRYLREALQVLAALAPTLEEAIQVAARKAYVVLDGTLQRMDRVAMASGNDRPVPLRQAQDSRRERADHRRPGREADLGIARAARRTT